VYHGTLNHVHWTCVKLTSPRTTRMEIKQNRARSLRSLCTSTSKAFSCKIYLRPNEFFNRDWTRRFYFASWLQFQSTGQTDRTSRNALASYLGSNVFEYGVWGYSRFSSVSCSKFWDSTSIWSRLQYFKFFQIQQSSVFLTLDAVRFSHWQHDYVRLLPSSYCFLAWFTP
jgi:hypothetical protein